VIDTTDPGVTLQLTALSVSSLPSAASARAAYCNVCPAEITAAAGAIWTDATAPGPFSTTTTRSRPTFPPTTAITSVLPADFACRSPAGVTAATAVSLVAHWTAVTGSSVPSAASGVTASSIV